MIIFKNSQIKKTFGIFDSLLKVANKRLSQGSSLMSKLNEERERNLKFENKSEFEKFKEEFSINMEVINEEYSEKISYLYAKKGEELFNDKDLNKQMLNQDPCLWLDNMILAFNKISESKGEKEVVMFLKELFASIIEFFEITLYLPQNEFFPVYNRLQNLMDTLSNFIISRSNQKYEDQFRIFSNNIFRKVKNKNNFFILICYTSFLSAKFRSNYQALLYEDSIKHFEIKGGKIRDIRHFYQMFNVPSIKAVRLSEGQVEIVQDFVNIFSQHKLEIMSMKSMQNLQNSEVNVKKLNQLFCDLMIMFQLLINSKVIKWVGDASKIIFKLDNVIGDYLDATKDKEMILFLTLQLQQVNLKTIDVSGIVLPRIFVEMCKNFNFTVLENNLFYSVLHMRFIRSYIKESFTNKISVSIFYSNIFYLYNYVEKNFKKVEEELKPDLVIALVNYFSYVKIELGEGVLEGFNKILDNLDMDRATNLSFALSATAASENPNMQFIRRVMEACCNEKKHVFRVKSKILFGYSALLAKFEDFNLWKKWFNDILDCIPELNDFDQRMLVDMKSIFRLYPPEYEEFIDLISSKVRHRQDKQDFKRWFLSESLGTSSLMETSYEKAFKFLGVNFQTQLQIQGLLIDFLLGDKVILEINGPQHYYISNLHKLHRKSRIKTEVLEKLGYYVINFSVLDFEKDVNKNTERILAEVKKRIPAEEYKKIFLKK